jgi:DNA repair photolyase
MVDHVKGRGALSNRVERFQERQASPVDDGWPGDGEDEASSIATSVTPEQARSIITYNQSPDIGFDRSINPYRGCEHGCIYCYARPSHAYLGLSPGLDFETRLTYKADAATLLRTELSKPSYRCAPLMLGANTDPYQPVEKRLRVTRSVLEVLLETRHPVSIVTKSALVLRDVDLLAQLAEHRLVNVMVSLTSMDAQLKRLLEPRAASPAARLGAMRGLAAAGVPVGTLIAPVIPVLTDPELETLLQNAVEAGARSAGYVLLRLPHELKALFAEWLQTHHPGKAAHVLSLLEQLRGGKLNDSEFGRRMTGAGVYASLLARRFRLASDRLGLDEDPRTALATDLFEPPRATSPQLTLAL